MSRWSRCAKCVHSSTHDTNSRYGVCAEQCIVLRLHNSIQYKICFKSVKSREDKKRKVFILSDTLFAICKSYTCRPHVRHIHLVYKVHIRKSSKRDYSTIRKLNANTQQAVHAEKLCNIVHVLYTQIGSHPPSSMLNLFVTLPASKVAFIISVEFCNGTCHCFRD